MIKRIPLIKRVSKMAAISMIMRAGALLPPEERLKERRKVIKEILATKEDVDFFYKWHYDEYLHEDDLLLVEERKRELEGK